jgi:hypothetical protein
MSLQEKTEDLDKPIWGVEAIAAATNLTVRQAYRWRAAICPEARPAESGSRLRAGCSPGFPARTEVTMATQYQHSSYAAAARHRGV